MRMVKAAVAGTPANREIVASGVLTVVLLLTQETYLWTWGLLAPAWATGAALLLNKAGTLVASLGATVVALFLVSIGDGLVPDFGRMMVAPYEADDQGLIGVFVGIALVMPFTNRFQLWFWQVVKLAEEGKEAQARLAVTEERLRFSRDLHDLVGHSLSAIAVKSEVAVKLSSVDAGRAVAEMDEVRGLARQALKEIRTAVRGYRTVDLDAELRSMTAVLEAAGIGCTLETPREQVPDELATLLAWVVREGTTNVLRHSSATRCRITVALRDGTAVLEMTNDGVAGTGGRGGTGLAGLSERLATVGGAVTAGGHGKGDGESSGCGRRSRWRECDDPGTAGRRRASDPGGDRHPAGPGAGHRGGGRGGQGRPGGAGRTGSSSRRDRAGHRDAGNGRAERRRDVAGPRGGDADQFRAARIPAAGARGGSARLHPQGRLRDELATAIRKVHSGGRYLDAEMAASAMMAGESPLTERERGALALAAQGAPVGEIAASLHLTEGTVRNYLSSAITKLGATNRINAIRAAQEKGWL